VGFRKCELRKVYRSIEIYLIEWLKIRNQASVARVFSDFTGAIMHLAPPAGQGDPDQHDPECKKAGTIQLLLFRASLLQLDNARELDH